MVTEDEKGQTTILIVEDDPTISDLLAYNLRRIGYRVRQEQSGRAGLEAALSAHVDLILLDLMLPGLDGLAVAREVVRRKPGLPIIMLTARADRETVLEGFQSGADDYVTKPFDMDVLLARISARLKDRVRRPEKETSQLGRNLLDPDSRELVTERGRMQLKPKEYDLMDLLLSAPGRLLTREEIVERIWHHRYLPGSRTLDVHVRRLRTKLEELGAPVAIDTVRGVGYRLVAAGEEARGDGGAQSGDEETAGQ